VLPQKKILLLGLGSEILKDDGIGSKIVNDLAKNFECQDVDFATALLGGWELLETIKDYYSLIVIDAIKTNEANPGDIFRYSLENFRATLHLVNNHESGFKETLELGHKIGFDLPKIIRVIAIEIEEDSVFGAELTDRLSENYDGIVHTIRTYLTSFINIHLRPLVLN